MSVSRKPPTRESLVRDTEWVTGELHKELDKEHPNRGRILMLRLSLEEHLRRLNLVLDREEMES